MGIGSRLRSLDVVVSSDCNLRCAYCYQNAKKPGVITWDHLRPALDLLLESERQKVTLLFLGGEPLLGFPVIRRAVRYVGTRRRRPAVVDCAISTNGMLLDWRAAAFFARHDFDLQLSFDGVPEAQDLRGAGTGERLDRLLQRLRLRSPVYFHRRVSVAVTVLPRTLRHLADTIDYLLASGVQDISLTAVITRQPDWRPDRIGLLDDVFAQVHRSCMRHYRRTGLMPVRLMRRGPAGAGRHEPNPWLCGAGGGEALAVDVDGELSGCVLFARSYQRFPAGPLGRAMSRLQLGPVTAPDLATRLAGYEGELFQAGPFFGRAQKQSSYGRCASCQWRRECSVCPVSIVRQSGNDDPHRIPDFVCAFNRVAAAWRHRSPRTTDSRRLIAGVVPAPPLVREVLARAGALQS